MASGVKMPHASSAYAGLGRRSVSALLDMVCIMPLYWLLKQSGLPAGAADVVLLLVMGCAYIGCFTSRWQATPAMRWLGIYATDRNGTRLSLMRAAGWCVASMVLMALVLSPVWWLQQQVDVRAVNSMLMEAKAQGQSPDDTLARVEAAMGMPFRDYYTRLYGAFFASAGLMLCWGFTVVLGREKAGAVNWLCAVRFKRGRVAMQQ